MPTKTTKTTKTKVPYFTKLDRDLRETMRRYKEEVGVPEAQQIDRALRAWFEDKADDTPRTTKRRTR